jgi:hypothetical protein
MATTKAAVTTKPVATPNATKVDNKLSEKNVAIKVATKTVSSPTTVNQETSTAKIEATKSPAPLVAEKPPEAPVQQPNLQKQPNPQQQPNPQKISQTLNAEKESKEKQGDKSATTNWHSIPIVRKQDD